MRTGSIIIGVLLALLALPAQAGVLSRIMGAAEHTGGRAARHGAGALDNVAAHIRSLPHTAEGHALAAAATPEGHWRFVNRAGETITAASPEEMRHALQTLLPQAAGGESKVALYLSEETVLTHRAALKDLPPAADLHILAGKDAYRLLRRADAAGEHLFAEVRPGLLVELGEGSHFAETMFQLARPLNKANIRVLALEPGAGGPLTAAPRLEAGGGGALTDVVDPKRLGQLLPAIRGQTALLTGKVEGDVLHFKPASGPEGRLSLAELTAAAEASDVNLVIVKSATSRQPGARNWLWLRAKVRGLDAALERATLADFLDALGGPGNRMTVAATPQGALRTRIDARPAPELGGAPTAGPFSGLFTDIVSEVAGRIVTTGIEINASSAERQRELDARIVPGVPSFIQFGYIVLLVIGLFGLPVALGWWQRVWPAEQRGEYGSAFGYLAARGVRGTVMVAAFVPLVAVASAPAQAVLSAWHTVLGVWNFAVLFCRALTWPFRRLFRAGA